MRLVLLARALANLLTNAERYGRDPQSGRLELADSILEQAATVDPSNAKLHFLQGKRHQQEGRLAQALDNNIGLMACDDLCPMEIPLQANLALVRRKMALASLRHRK